MTITHAHFPRMVVIVESWKPVFENHGGASESDGHNTTLAKARNSRYGK